jgi:hypothetical protein
VAAWGVAGIVAYYLWIKPERELRLEQEEVQQLCPSSFKQAHYSCTMLSLSLSLIFSGHGDRKEFFSHMSLSCILLS